MYYCCKSVGNCCADTCNSICQCITDACHCISDIFSEPFSFVTFLSFFICGGPFLYGIVSYAQYKDIVCDTWIAPHLLVLSFCHIVNFFFFVYLFCTFSRNKQKLQEDKFKDKTVCETVGYLILYDFGVCFYMLVYIFEFIWIIIGHDLYGKEPWDSDCFTLNNGNLMNCELTLLIILDVYLFITIVGSILVLLYYACQQGSCGLIEFCTCIYFILSCGFCCGMCCIGQNNRKSKIKTNEKQKNNPYVKKGSKVMDGMNWQQKEQQVPQQQQKYAYNPQQYNPTQDQNPQYNIQMQQQPNQGYNYPQMQQPVNQQPVMYNPNGYKEPKQKKNKKKPFYQCW